METQEKPVEKPKKPRKPRAVRKPSAPRKPRVKKAKTLDVHTYTATMTFTGTGQFPYDMLRYDNCWPASTEDVLAMTDHLNPEGRRVTLTTRLPGFSTARWASFGWLPPAKEGKPVK